VEALCERVSIIRAGRTVQSGNLAELRQLTRTSVVAETARPVVLDGIEGVHGLEADDRRVRFDVDTHQLDAVLHRLTDAGVTSLVCHPPTLEELFLRHYGDELDAG
jgi:ABC-2 type transport system ATP-binding protein